VGVATGVAQKTPKSLCHKLGFRLVILGKQGTFRPYGTDSKSFFAGALAQQGRGPGVSAAPA